MTEERAYWRLPDKEKAFCGSFSTRPTLFEVKTVRKDKNESLYSAGARVVKPAVAKRAASIRTKDHKKAESSIAIVHQTMKVSFLRMH